MPVFSTILSNTRGCVMLAKNIPHKNLRERSHYEGVFLSITPADLKIDVRGVLVQAKFTPPPQNHDGNSDSLIPGLSEESLFNLLIRPPNYDTEEVRKYEQEHVEALFGEPQLTPTYISKGSLGPNDGYHRYAQEGIELLSLPIVDYERPHWNTLDFGSEDINRQVLDTIAQTRQLCP